MHYGNTSVFLVSSFELFKPASDLAIRLGVAVLGDHLGRKAQNSRNQKPANCPRYRYRVNHGVLAPRCDSLLNWRILHAITLLIPMAVPLPATESPSSASPSVPPAPGADHT